MKEFELKPEHVVLLRNSYVNDRLSECEYGAAEIDCKRPYGNSAVEQDIAELLKLPWLDDEDDWQINDEVRAQCRKWHSDTPLALQVVLSSGSFVPGVYRAEQYGYRWKLVYTVSSG